MHLSCHLVAVTPSSFLGALVVPLPIQNSPDHLFARIRGIHEPLLQSLASRFETPKNSNFEYIIVIQLLQEGGVNDVSMVSAEEC